MGPVTTTLYSRDILRLAATIPHLGRLDSPEASAEKSSPICGSRVVVDVTLDEEGRIAALGQEIRACALGQASASLMADHAIGRSFAELLAARDALGAFLAGQAEDLDFWPGMAVFRDARSYSARHASIRLAFEAVTEAAALALAARSKAAG